MQRQAVFRSQHCASCVAQVSASSEPASVYVGARRGALRSLVFLDSSWRIGDGRLQINLFIDSNVALGTLLRGTSRQPDLNDLVTDIWFQTASRAALLLAWRVPSKLDIADVPTRPAERASELQGLIDEGFEEVGWLWPESAPWQ